MVDIVPPIPQTNTMPPMPRTGPECGNDPTMCRITNVSRVQEPIIDWTPEYDGTGRMINGDPNTFIRVISCSACSGEWEDTTTAGSPPARRTVQEPNTL